MRWKGANGLQENPENIGEKPPSSLIGMMKNCNSTEIAQLLIVMIFSLPKKG
jgi:hypothetical protein